MTDAVVAFGFAGMAALWLIAWLRPEWLDWTWRWAERDEPDEHEDGSA